MTQNVSELCSRMYCGILVGGQSTRMGYPKGLVTLPGGEALLARQIRIVRDAKMTPVLVGCAAPYAAVAEEVVRIEDAETNGPIAGLLSLLRFAIREPFVAMIAVDMPHIRASDLLRLQHLSSRAAIVVGRSDRLEPFFSRFVPAGTAAELEQYVARGGQSLHRFFTELGCEEMPLHDSLLFQDWDSPADIHRFPVDPKEIA